MENNIQEITEYFIYLSNKEKRPITNKKLQKLLYYAQAWYLVFNGKELYEDKIEAWVHGPAIPHIYGQYKEYGFSPITQDIELKDVEITDEIKVFLNDIWKLYGKLDADYLELLTHQEEPWIVAREGLSSGDPSKRVIDTNLMKKFYTELLAKVRNGQE